jgi:1-acyl-sn-glycerol-3-phosphate acyltransferase
MSKAADIERPRLEYSQEHYDSWADKTETWLPRLGGYDYEVRQRLETDGGAILTPKHTGMMDVPLVGTVVRMEYGRHMRAPAKKELYDLPVVGEAIGDFFDKGGGIKLDRKVRIDHQPAGQQVEKALENGEWVELFGEGTRVRDQRVGKIKKGLAYLAIQHNVPMQAIGVAGTRHWVGRKFVVLGEVFTPDLDKIDPEDRKSPLRYASELTKDIHRAMQEATDRAYAQRDRMQVYIPFFRATKPDKK